MVVVFSKRSGLFAPSSTSVIALVPKSWFFLKFSYGCSLVTAFCIQSKTVGRQRQSVNVTPRVKPLVEKRPLAFLLSQ